MSHTLVTDGVTLEQYIVVVGGVTHKSMDSVEMLLLSGANEWLHGTLRQLEFFINLS